MTTWIELEDKIIAYVRKEVAPALGCTEPISLAFAAATARKYLGSMPERIEGKVSPNLMKNGMGVTVPATGTAGLLMAAAIGAIGGNSEAGLEVLKGITSEQVEHAKAMIAAHQIRVDIADTNHVLYSEANLYAGKNHVRVCIEDAHINIVLIEKNGEVVFSRPSINSTEETTSIFEHLTTRDIYEFALQVNLEKIRFIYDAKTLNEALSQEGLKNQYGLHIGRTLQKQIERGLISNDLLNQIVIETSAASDARMGGAALPAMSNSGSGNQGIAATMPVVVVARYVKADEEKTIRALFMAHLMAIYIHSKFPKLSALCAVTTASMGSTAGVAWLLTGRFETVSMAINSMIGDISGIICDGASNSCAMKVSTSVTAGYKSVLLAMDNSRVSGADGIVEEDIDRSINNLCSIASCSMDCTDKHILNIMVNKPQ